MKLALDKYNQFKADLHIHTCLSPCADIEMSPIAIVHEAKEKGLQILGICDHNSAENVSAVEKSARGEGIKIIGGMEVTSKEEVHILALFGNKKGLFKMQEFVYDNLPGKNNAEVYGEQIVVNEFDEIIDFNERLLIGATTLSLEDIVKKTHDLDGIAIPSHVDRETFSIISNLGFIPEKSNFDALEIVDISRREEIQGGKGFTFITSSDAHFISEIGKRYTLFVMRELNFKELRKGLRGENGKMVIV